MCRNQIQVYRPLKIFFIYWANQLFTGLKTYEKIT